VLAELERPEHHADPYPVLDRLRESEPLHRTNDGFYLVSGHADARLLLRGTGTLFVAPDLETLTNASPDFLGNKVNAMMLDTVLMKAPPEHTRLRALVSRDFTARRIEALGERITGICAELLDAVAEPLSDGAVVDLHGALSKPLAVRVFAELFGVPDADRELLVTAAAEVVGPFEGASAGQLAVADQATRLLAGYFHALIGRRRREPGADLISALVRVHDGDPDRLDDDELVAMLWLLWLDGFENTANAIDSALQALLRHPEQRSWLRGDLRGAVAFTNEVMRHDGTVVFASGIPRIAVREVEFDGGAVPAGADVRPVFAAANRDPSVFEDPGRFDPARDTSGALGFGLGIHHCLGAAFARSQITICLRAVHARFPTLVAAGEATWSRVLPQRSVDWLPVALDQ
jgi:cytochrome P450